MVNGKQHSINTKKKKGLRYVNLSFKERDYFMFKEV